MTWRDVPWRELPWYLWPLIPVAWLLKKLLKN